MEQSRVQELERDLRRKDEELELAAQLGQALVRKETKQSEQLAQAMARIKELEGKLERERDEKTMLLQTPNSKATAQSVAALEEENDKLRYELKRAQFKFEHAVGGAANKSGNVLVSVDTDCDAEARGEASALLELKRLHLQELQALRADSGEAALEHIRLAERETWRAVERLERLLDLSQPHSNNSSRRTSLASSIASLNYTPSVSSVESPRAQKQHQTVSHQLIAHFLAEPGGELTRPGRQHDVSAKSFASKFSTETLELDLCEVSRDELFEEREIATAPDPEHASLRLRHDTTSSTVVAANATKAEKGSRTSTRGPPPPVPTRPNLAPGKLKSAGRPKSSLTKENGAASDDVPDRHNLPPALHVKGVEDVAKALTRRFESERGFVDGAEGRIKDSSDGAQRAMRAQAIDDRDGGKGHKEDEGDQDDSGSECSAESFKTRRRGRSRTRRPRKPAPAFSSKWARARKGNLLVKLASARKSEKWSARFCVYVDKQLYIFRSELDAMKYSAHVERAESEDGPSSGGKKLPYRPLRTMMLDQTELRVIRRPSAQNEADNDARSSMMVWLRKRNYSVEAGDAQAAHGKPIYKLHLVEHDHHTLSTVEPPSFEACGNLGGSCVSDLTSETGSSTSGASVSTFASSISYARSRHHVYLALPVEAERTAWIQDFSRTSHVVQVDAGSVWIKSMGRKRDGEWIKRYAVVRPGRLELHDYDSEILRESVSLTSVKVEPAYSAHIFLSHKQHQKQLVTLRTYDGTERNWWVAALRSCCPRKGAADGAYGRSGSGHSQDSAVPGKMALQGLAKAA